MHHGCPSHVLSSIFMYILYIVYTVYTVYTVYLIHNPTLTVLQGLPAFAIFMDQNLIFRWSKRSNRQTSIFRTSLTHPIPPPIRPNLFLWEHGGAAPRTEARTASLESFGKVDFAKTDAKKWEVSPQSPQIKGIQTNIGRDCTNFPTA